MTSIACRRGPRKTAQRPVALSRDCLHLGVVSKLGDSMISIYNIYILYNMYICIIYMYIQICIVNINYIYIHACFNHYASFMDADTFWDFTSEPPGRHTPFILPNQRNGWILRNAIGRISTYVNM